MPPRKHQYLAMKEPDEAWRLLRATMRVPDPPASEEIAVEDAAGRVTAEAVYARLSSPFYHGSAMDGFAVRSAATAGASEAAPVRLALAADAQPIDTGDPIPAGFDAVVMIEHVHHPDPATVEIVKAVAPWQHVRLMGEDLVTGEMIAPSGRVLSPFDVGALLAAGLVNVRVRRRPRVALIPTGSEIVEPGAPLRAGDIIEFNTRMLAAMVEGWGGEAVRRAPVPDDLPALRAALAEALASADIVVLNAGSSAGSEDFTAKLVAEAGDPLVHGVNLMPGKPTVLGVARGSGKPVIGLPGYPVSTVVAAERFLRPAVSALLGVAPPERERMRARLMRKLPSKVGHEEVIRVQLGVVGGRAVAVPLPRGAGVITSLARAAGLVGLPAMSEGFEAGTDVDVELLAPRREVEGALLHVGSHDLLLDVAGDVLRHRHAGRSLVSSHAGSVGGLVSLERGECHLAGCHLVDPESGGYNDGYVRRYLPGRRVHLVHLALREQGFIVPRGNPKGLRGVADLGRGDLRLANRQRGAGTRVLLDLRLCEAGIAGDRIPGYQREEYTHMGVAVAVASGVADVGLGIRAAATAVGLDFVPLESEPYELAFTDQTRAALEPLLALLSGAEFRAAARTLPGYDPARSGELRTIAGRSA